MIRKKAIVPVFLGLFPLLVAACASKPADHGTSGFQYSPLHQLFVAADTDHDREAILKLAYMYDTGTGGVPHNLGKSWDLYMELASQGDTEAQIHIANICFNAFADYPCALSWYQKAADGGNPDGVKNVAYLTKYNAATLEERKKADEFYRTAQPVTAEQWARKGFADAMKQAIGNRKNFSRAALNARTRGTAVVQFEYTGGGKAADVSIYKSSGSDFEDTSAVQAVEAAVLPDRPASMSGMHHYFIAVGFNTP